MKIIKEKLREQFWRDIKRLPEERNERKIANASDVILTIKEIYYGKPVSPIFMRFSKRKEMNKRHKVEIEVLLTDIGNRIYDYFVLGPNRANDRVNFDLFHGELCESFLEGINKIRKNDDLAELTYGQAQKLINLTFKYLTTYSDYEKYADLFHFSHMVIDSTVLETLLSNRKLSQFIKIGSTKVDFTVSHGWTNMDKEEYYNLLTEYRKAIDSYLGDKSYMHLEYCIWSNKRHPILKLKNSGGVDAIPISKFHKWEKGL